MCFDIDFNLWKDLVLLSFLKIRMLVFTGVSQLHFLLKARRVQGPPHVEQWTSP